MSTTTKNLGLFKYDPKDDKDETFDIEKALNANWEKIDEALSSRLTKVEIDD